MKHKKDAEKLFEEEVPEHLHRKTMRRLEEEAARGSEAPLAGLWRVLRSPWASVPAFAAAALAVGFLYTARKKQVEPGAVAVKARHDPEMVLNAALFMDLKVLMNQKSLERAGKWKWRKKKS